ncbi:hypothetical protein ABVK25_003222 [Lepraria finkii]|uniref:Uncharacterized protein n=1 Tax=Lepraria finkii TaxID=1340010 RepID=A0ABR4BEE0_9LECA
MKCDHRPGMISSPNMIWNDRSTGSPEINGSAQQSCVNGSSVDDSAENSDNCATTCNKCREGR